MCEEQLIAKQRMLGHRNEPTASLMVLVTPMRTPRLQVLNVLRLSAVTDPACVSGPGIPASGPGLEQLSGLVKLVWFRDSRRQSSLDSTK